MAKPISNTLTKPATELPAAPKALRVPYPFLWLALAVLAVYSAVFSLGFTELDDSIFVRDMRTYNEDTKNLVTSFGRGVFDAQHDTYYRPLFLDAMVLNYQVSGEEPLGYHVVNLLLHLLAVCLLFVLLKDLRIKQWQAFALALIFAVHPVLTQAVAWIPGRNDTMLGIWLFAFFIAAIRYTNNGKTGWLAFSFFCLCGAFFTKETAVFAAPSAAVLLVIMLRKSWKEQRMLTQYGCWIAAFLLWYLVRAHAALDHSPLSPGVMAHEAFIRTPVVLHYMGKIFLPFNLSVFPILKDTVWYFGAAAMLLLAVIIALAKGKDMPTIVAGVLVFLLFVLPALLVPAKLNEQTFEHRLYLPIIGILILLPQTVLFRNNFTEKQVFGGCLMIALVLGIVTYNREQYFHDPLTFWQKASTDSPHSGYAMMMLAAREPDKNAGHELMRRAYAMEPDQKYINFYYGTMLQEEDSVLQSEKYLMAEKKISNYYEVDFYLARVAFEKKNFDAAATYLRTYLVRDSENQQGNNNLLLLYLQTNQIQAAAAQAARMQKLGVPVPKDVLQRLSAAGAH